MNSSMTSSMSMGMGKDQALSAEERVLKVLNGSQSSEETLELMKKIPDMLDAKTIEMEALISPMIKLVASHNPEIKAQACDFICRAAGAKGVSDDNCGPHQEVAILAANILNGDLSDANPTVRSGAVSTICSLPALAEQHSVDAINLALRDSNPNVRKAGVTGCGKVFKHSPQVIEDHGMIDVLYQQIKDPDPTVLTFTLQTLNYILQDEGGVVINNAMAKYLIKRLDDFPDLELCFLLEYLQKYFCPREDASDERKFMILNALDPFLESKKGSVFLSAINLFYECCKSLRSTEEGPDKLIEDFLTKITPQIVKFLKPSSQAAVQNFQIQLVDFILSVDKTTLGKISTTLVKELAIRSKDFSSLKKKKIEVIAHLCTDDRVSDIVQYFVGQVRNHNDVADELIRAACSLSKNHTDPNNKLSKYLQVLMKEDKNMYGVAILRNMRLIPTVEEDSFGDLLVSVCRYFLSKSSITPLDKLELQNFLWILSNHTKRLDDCPYYLEQLLEDHKSELKSLPDSVLIWQNLLFCGVRVFCVYPAASQHVLGEIFELCEQVDDVFLEEKMRFYARLLQSDDFIRKFNT